MPSIVRTLAAHGLRLQVDVQLTSASAVRRFIPMQMSERDANVPSLVRAASVLPDGTGAARTLLRSMATLASNGDPIDVPRSCSELARMNDPLSAVSSRPRNVGVGGARLRRHEATSVVATLWLTFDECRERPVSSVFPVSPSLVFVSAYGTDPRTVTLPAAASDTIFAPKLTADESVGDAATGISRFLRGILAQVTKVDWTVTGLPSGDAKALNASSYSYKLPAKHTLSWTSSALASALPPYALLPGYYYTATASVTLQAAWAWDADAFVDERFPPKQPPIAEAVLRSASLLETITLGPESPWPAASSQAGSASTTLGRTAALAYVTLPPGAASLLASPAAGTALVTSFNLTAASAKPPSEVVDITTLTPSSDVSTAALVSSLLTTYPMHGDAVAAIIATVTGGTVANNLFTSSRSWCSDIRAPGTIAASTTNAVAVLPVWAFPLRLLSHALAVAAALDVARNAPSSLGVDLTQAAGISDGLMLASGRAVFGPAAALCAQISTSIVTALVAAPLNANAPLVSPPLSSGLLQYSFRVGTRPLSALPEGTVEVQPALKFINADDGIAEALLRAVPLQLSSDGTSTYIDSQAITGIQLPLPLQWGALSLSVPTLVPVYVLVLDETQAVTFGVINIPLLPPLPPGAAENANMLSFAIANLASNITANNINKPPIDALLTIATLSSMLGTNSTGQLVSGTTVAGDTDTNSENITASNTATRGLLLDATADALDRFLLQSTYQQNTTSNNSRPLLDDTTLGVIALTVRSLTLDPFELSSDGADVSIGVLSSLMKASLVGSINIRDTVDANVSDTDSGVGAEAAVVVQLPTEVSMCLQTSIVNIYLHLACLCATICRSAKSFLMAY